MVTCMFIIMKKVNLTKLSSLFKKKMSFFGKSKVCEMTEISGAVDKSSNFDGNKFLLQCEKNEYVYISGLEIFQFKTDDKIIDYIFLLATIWFLMLKH